MREVDPTITNFRIESRCKRTEDRRPSLLVSADVILANGRELRVGARLYVDEGSCDNFIGGIDSLARRGTVEWDEQIRILDLLRGEAGLFPAPFLTDDDRMWDGILCWGRR